VDSLIAVIAHFTRLPAVVPQGALRFEGAVTVWPSQYTGGKETGSAAIKLGGGRNQSVFGLYLDPSAVSQFASVTEPEGLFAFELGVRANDGAAEFSVVSVDLAEGNKAASSMTASIETPVLTRVAGGIISVLWHAEAESHLDIAAPAGNAWNPALEQFVGMTLPSLEVAFERRLVPGAVQNPVTTRAVGGDARLFVPAHPRADLSSLSA
jgi:hypothetical protein